LNGIEYIRLDPIDPHEGLARLSAALNRLIEHQAVQLEAKRQEERLESLRKQQDQELMVVAGAVLLIVGLIIISQSGS
jgi:hypothetical protein